MPVSSRCDRAGGNFLSIPINFLNNLFYSVALCVSSVVLRVIHCDTELHGEGTERFLLFLSWFME
jgi:hypothetical protein